MANRTVHAEFRGEFGRMVEVVRYERAGKWWLEWDGGRRAVSVADAATHAVSRSGVVFLGRPGGRLFDAKVCQSRTGTSREAESA